MNKFLFCVSILLILAFVCVKAQTSGLRERFDGFDANKDGVISGVEMDASPLLRTLDLDQNGSLTLLEAVKALRQRAQASSEATSTGTSGADRRLFDFLDKNKDGTLTREELPREDWLKRLDGDGDGRVTFAEADVVVAQMRARGEALPRISSTPDSGPEAAKITAEWTEAPQPLKATEHGVGRQVPDLQAAGKALSQHLQGKKGLLIAFFGATCPISGKLGPELARLEADCAAQQIGMILVCPVASESAEEQARFVTTHGLGAPLVHDVDQTLTTTLRASTTTEVFLLDAARTLIYRGAIHDQYGLGYAKDQPTRTFLRDAILALLSSQRPAVAATTAPGCALDLRPASNVSAASATTVTYHREIARIMQASCLECHRQGGVGPFSLQSYEDVLEHAGMIRKQVQRGAMPPWFAAAPAQGTESPWANDCSLSAQDKADLLAWLDSPDRPLGNPADAPVPLSFPTEWALGEPDAIFQLSEPISIKAEGTMPYQFATVATSFSEDRWVNGYEIRPTDASVVHHVIVNVHEKGSRVRDRGEGAGGYWAAYVPGNTHHRWPEGFAKKLPAGATISFQIHYTPNGRKTQDQLRIGLHFASSAPRYIVHTASVSHLRLSIPPGASHHVEVKEQPVPMDMHVLAYMAHMHVRGKAFKYEATLPDGSHQVLLDIPRYDFNWQLRYDLATPKLLPRGSKVKITAVYDNSAGNPANPDPTKTVRWGPQTHDEMMIGYVEYFTPNLRDVAAR
jgi:mono/diheme cytochrome c family protein/Ca2+-binding EF-hand superfamily protein